MKFSGISTSQPPASMLEIIPGMSNVPARAEPVSAQGKGKPLRNVSLVRRSGYLQFEGEKKK